jgi:beta-xylosidase
VAIQIPGESDEFNSKKLALQWQWNHNPDDSKWSLTERRGHLRLRASNADSLLQARNTLTQMLSDPEQTFTASMDVGGMTNGQIAGLCLLQSPPAWIGVEQKDNQRFITLLSNDQKIIGPRLTTDTVQLQACVTNGIGDFQFSLDGQTFTPLGDDVKLYFSWWKGARIGLFSYNTTSQTNATLGYADFDWFHVKDGM